MMKDVLALEAENITVNLGGRKVLSSCSLRAKRGEFIGIIGPNGAGKSTLLKSVLGFIPREQGAVAMFGQSVSSLSAKEKARLAAYMQQSVQLTFGFTGLDVVMAGRYPHLRWWQPESKEDRRIALACMEFTGTACFKDTPVHQLSGGERQRVLMAKVLAQEAPLVLLDEPTASLDLVYQEEIFRYCQTLGQQGKSVLMVVHDLRLAAKFCSRLVLLRQGEILADGLPEEVLTSGNLESAYGLHSAVYWNQVTGNLDIHTYVFESQQASQKKIHILGGGGAAGELMRKLHEYGYTLTAGVLRQGDTDAAVADAFSIPYISLPPFHKIFPENWEENKRKSSQADVVVLANICYGMQNIKNLEIALHAQNLIVIEDTPFFERDFTEGEAWQLYQKVVQHPRSLVVSTEQFLKMAEADELLSFSSNMVGAGA